VGYGGTPATEEGFVATPSSVEEYLAGLPDDSRTALEGLRGTVKAAVPEATETISYQMPAFKHHDRFLVSYAAFKDHLSLFPASGAVMKAHGEALKPYFSGKGTLRFPVEEPMPDALMRKIVKTRMEEVSQRGLRSPAGRGRPSGRPSP
jgi:uncharacterized protein YdhG (YjbR/CyaY superfamily)